MKERRKSQSMTRLYGGIVGLIVLLVVSAGAMGCGGTSSGSDGHDNIPVGAKSGSWDGECEAGLFNKCDDETARKKIKPVEVYCLWEGRDVMVHVKLRSEFNARLKVSVIPRYVIKDGGQHGTAAGSETAKRVAAQGTVVFDINAGHPMGVPDGTEISECKPKMYDVGLTN
jgi:hypothetical protein